MTKRMVGRRLVDDNPPKALKVVVYRRWPWQQDEFYNEGEIGVNITAGVLMITMPGEIISYNQRHWRRVVSTEVSSRSQA